MFKKRHKFKEETTPERRLSDRWDQQVFFITRKFPQAQAGISAIVKEHASKQGTDFIPSDEALTDLANLYSTLRGPA